jgi:hypothetical protein
VLDSRQPGASAPLSPPPRARKPASVRLPAKPRGNRPALIAGVTGLVAAGVLTALVVTPALLSRDTSPASNELRGPVPAATLQVPRAQMAIAPPRASTAFDGAAPGATPRARPGRRPTPRAERPQPALAPRLQARNLEEPEAPVEMRTAVQDVRRTEPAAPEAEGATLLAVSGSGLLGGSCDRTQAGGRQLVCQDGAAAKPGESSNRALVTALGANVPRRPLAAGPAEAPPN